MHFCSHGTYAHVHARVSSQMCMMRTFMSHQTNDSDRREQPAAPAWPQWVTVKSSPQLPAQLVTRSGCCSILSTWSSCVVNQCLTHALFYEHQTVPAQQGAQLQIRYVVWIKIAFSVCGEQANLVHFRSVKICLWQNIEEEKDSRRIRRTLSLVASRKLKFP